jgi:tripartite-type tricarboxylate transporter receptor subunit TctC
MKSLLFVLSVALTGFFATVTSAQPGYPSKPVRLVIPWPPGGPTDLVGRPIARKLEEALGQPVVVENRGGAGGTIGAELVAKSAPDGYTLLVGGLSTHGIGPSIYPKLGYDALEDFEHVTVLASVPNVLVVHPSMPVKTVQDLVALARKHPGKLNYASVGVGSTSHLMTEMINSMAGIKTVQVPYKGGTPAVTALLGGEVHFYIGGLPALMPHVKAGKMRALAVTAERRSPHLPDVPTMIEAGFPGYDVTSWYAIVAPAGTPRTIVSRLNDILVKAVKSAEITEALTKLGADPLGTTPEETRAFVRRELAVWAKAVQDSGAKFE